MQMTIRAILWTSLTIIGTSPMSGYCHAQRPNTTRGATVGGVAGAVIGGIIGHQNDEATEGILIGSAIGAITGGVAGHTRDAQNNRNQRYWQSRQSPPIYSQPSYPTAGYPVYTNPQPYVVATPAPLVGVSMTDIIQMSQSGLSPSVMINHLQSNGLTARPQTTEIIQMHRAGVSELVINATQNAPLASQRAAAVYPTSAQPVYQTPGRVYVPAQTYQPGPRIYHMHRGGYPQRARYPF
jgi:hypothetical protein